MSAIETTAYSRVEDQSSSSSINVVMGSLIRSEEMVLCQLFLPPESAYCTISELGEAGIVEFRDLNGDMNAFQRKFASEVKRCDEMERQLRYIEAEIHRDKISIPENQTIPRAPLPREMNLIEATLEQTETEMIQLSQNGINIKKNYIELTEMRYVLECTNAFLNQQEASRRRSSLAPRILEEDMQIQRGRLGFVAGVVDRYRVAAFERILWRISRGNVFCRLTPIEQEFEDPATGNPVYKTVFLVYFQGDQLKNRVKKICEGFRAAVYNIPEKDRERVDMLESLNTRLIDLQTIMNQTHDHRVVVLSGVAKDLQNWIIKIRKMKAIYHTLNMLNVDVTKKCLIGECWTPLKQVTKVQHCLDIGMQESGCPVASVLHAIPTNEMPPTYHPTNKFTRGFQNLIDAYGVASYREANPALYTIITFPFLFALMFGDLGHGFILFLSGLMMVMLEKKYMHKRISNEIARIFFGGRYIILLMGLFSMYTGLIYNDLFSKSINLLGSHWHNHYTKQDLENSTVSEYELIPEQGYDEHPYIFGMDPVWQVSTNKIIILNSFKMKLAIIIGVTHMLFGICVSLINIKNFKNFYLIFVEFIPHVLFLSSLILYMTFMMFYKWIMYADPGHRSEPYSSRCAPSILIMFIDMIMLTPPDKVEGCNQYMYNGQDLVQKILMLILVASVPVMLLGKPLIIMSRRKAQAKAAEHHHGIELTQNAVEESHEPPSHGGGHGDDLPMADIWINQGIHTIEFCLNTISHTASYLRLWALSLAHSQLSEVLWTMVLKIGLGGSSYVDAGVLFFIFSGWATATIAILVLMEGLSAFLHTLRLHWVEFMSKFYEGMGVMFMPFSFKQILEDAEDEG